MEQNQRKDDEWLADVLEGATLAGAEGLEPLRQVREMQTAYRVLLQHEAERLKQIHGEDHPLVVEMQNRLGRNLAVVEALEVEDQLSRIRVAETGEKETLVHGRITDERSRGLAGYTVALTDEEGKDLGVETGKVDSTGYFSVVVPEEQAAKLASGKKSVFLTIRNRKGEICESRAISQAVTPGVRVVETIALSGTQREAKTAEDRKTTGPAAARKATKRTS